MTAVRNRQAFHFRPITASLSPNCETDDVWLAGKTLLTPWRWRRGQARAVVQKWFSDYFGVNTAVAFNSGRSALLSLLWAFGVGKGDEVLVQAFTCVAVPNSVIWAGAKPVYVDVDETLNLDPRQMVKKITPLTRAVIVQHTFGLPARMETITALARKYRLIVIEDCAHSLGARYRGRKIGTLGDGACFSFGRDKVVSSVFGGLAIVNPKHRAASLKLAQLEVQLPYPGLFWIFQQLLHPLAFWFILRLYNLYLGKFILFALQQLHLLSRPVYPQEKQGLRPRFFPAKFPNGLAILLGQQLFKLERYNRCRKEAAKYYQKTLTARPKLRLLPFMSEALYLRFPVLVSNPRQLHRQAKNRGVVLGNWYHHVIDPADVELAKVGYRQGLCPKAEQAARQIVNLPTRITLDQARQVASLL